MWFTIVILLSAFLLLVVPHWLSLPLWIHLPLVVLYMFVELPMESRAFRSWGKWKQWFHGQWEIKGPGAALLLEPNPSLPHMFAVHPHGVYAEALSLRISLDAKLLHVKAVATNVLFYLPLIKDLARLGGAIKATREAISITLECGDSVILCPGGLRELPGLDNDRLKKGDGFIQREGFLKIALSKGVPVVPIFADDPNLLYRVWIPWPWLQRIFLTHFLYPWPVLAWGRPWLPFWPLPNKQTLWVGEPIRVEGKELHELREEFYEAMAKLREKSKG